MYSKKKHNIDYVKPEEPAFITRLKAQAGYVEGPSVDTKREELPEIEDGDLEDRDDEKPTVVVMNDGDLTAEEADLYSQAKKEVDAIDKADLSKRVIFKRRSRPDDETCKEKSIKREKDRGEPKKPKKSKHSSKATLSFNDEEE